VWAALNLLDRQLVDRNGRLAGKIDDVEFALDDDPDALPRVDALLRLGALATRSAVTWAVGLASIERRLAARRDRAPSRIAFADVRSIGSSMNSLPPRRARQQPSANGGCAT